VRKGKPTLLGQSHRLAPQLYHSEAFPRSPYRPSTRLPGSQLQSVAVFKVKRCGQRRAWRLAGCDFGTGSTTAQRESGKWRQAQKVGGGLTACISEQSEPQQPGSKTPTQQATISPTRQGHASREAHYKKWLLNIRQRGLEK
jgi:hypothetical protein